MMLSSQPGADIFLKNSLKTRMRTQYIVCEKSEEHGEGEIIKDTKHKLKMLKPNNITIGIFLFFRK